MALKICNIKSKNNLGFTIVELLVVIVVIGILAAITIVSYSGITSKANESSIKAELANASKKLSMYYAENATFPTSLDINTGCPTQPVSSLNYCIKFSTGTKFIYNYKTASTYDLDAIKGPSVYEVTDNTSPIISPNWIVIGNQTWAKFNQNIGTRINGTVAQTDNGGTNVIEKYCYNDLESNCTLNNNGGLYQWDEAMQYTDTEGTRGICPLGSHIPSDNDWKVLEMQLGMTQAQADTPNTWRGTDQGAQLKSGGSSGLNVPLAGYRLADGLFYDLSSFADLWSSSESGGGAWVRHLRASQADVYLNANTKTSGFLVRCVGN